MSKARRRRGDRKDGILVRDMDAMHAFMPFLLPDRADNEAVMNETVDLTAINAYLAAKNAGDPEFRYTFFHVICAAMAKVIVLRPKMNRFYAGHRLYDRRDIVFSFVVKKKFTDDSQEALAMIRIDRDGGAPPIEQIYEGVRKIVYDVRKREKTDGTTEKIGILNKLPRPVLCTVIRALRWLDYHGWYPDALMKDDPYFSSVFISNLGSIRMNATYHHLTNWGTNSIFVVADEKKRMPYFSADGTYEMKETLGLGMTIDERIADGLYFANSIRLLRRLFREPSLLDLPIRTPVDETAEVTA